MREGNQHAASLTHIFWQSECSNAGSSGNGTNNAMIICTNIFTPSTSPFKHRGGNEGGKRDEKEGRGEGEGGTGRGGDIGSVPLPESSPTWPMSNLPSIWPNISNMTTTPSSWTQTRFSEADQPILIILPPSCHWITGNGCEHGGRCTCTCMVCQSPTKPRHSLYASYMHTQTHN